LGLDHFYGNRLSYLSQLNRLVDVFRQSIVFVVHIVIKNKRKKRAEEEEDRRKSAELDYIRKPSRKSEGDQLRFSTIGQLTNATVVTEPPHVFAKYMLRKSVDRLNTEFRVINEFRTRLEELKDKKHEEVIEKRNSRGNLLDE